MYDDDAVGYAAVTRPGRLAGEDYRDHDFTEADVSLMNARERWEREKRIQAHTVRVQRELKRRGLVERSLFDMLSKPRGPELFKEAS
jgi:hypothetical protein